MTDDAALSKLLVDYIALYTREGLPRWRELFLPTVSIAASQDDGAVTTWTLDSFYERQRGVFASGKPIRETLENTHVERTGSLASVRSDFVWTDGEFMRRGRLMLLVVRAGGSWKIHALAFEYLA